MKGILVYLAVFLVTLYMFFVFDENVPAFMLVLEVLYFFTTVVFVMIAKRKINVTLEKLISTAEKNQPIPLNIYVENKLSFFPVHFKIYLKIENLLTGEKAKIKTSRTVNRKETRIVTVPISAKSCGTMSVTLEKVRIYDVLMIMGTVQKIKASTQVRILPELHLIPVEITRKTKEFVADADEYSDSESGDDPSEIYQIREYTREDSVHDIHWKLSAKSDKLLVKEHGKALGSSVLIWINVSEKRMKKIQWKRHIGIHRLGKKQNNTNIISHNVLELAASISLSLFEEKCIHTVAWYEPENNMVRKKRVSKEINVYELMNRLALIKPCRDEEKIKAMYADAFRREHFSTVVEINMNQKVTVNGEQLELPIKNGDIQWEQLEMTL